MMQGLRLGALATVVMVGIALQPATPPRDTDPHDPNSAPVTTVAGCDAVADYANNFYALFDEHPDYATFWSQGNSEDAQDMDPDEVDTIIEDGRAFLDEMEQLTVPEAYVSGHEGIMLLLDSDIDFVEFYGVDTSNVPDLNQWNTGLALILKGEIMVAKECPDETEQAGGYIFLSITQLEDILGG